MGNREQCRFSVSEMYKPFPILVTITHNVFCKHLAFNSGLQNKEAQTSIFKNIACKIHDSRSNCQSNSFPDRFLLKERCN